MRCATSSPLDHLAEDRVVRVRVQVVPLPPVMMKNWLPPVFAPAFAMANMPGAYCSSALQLVGDRVSRSAGSGARRITTLQDVDRRVDPVDVLPVEVPVVGQEHEAVHGLWRRLRIQLDHDRAARRLHRGDVRLLGIDLHRRWPGELRLGLAGRLRRFGAARDLGGRAAAARPCRSVSRARPAGVGLLGSWDCRRTTGRRRARRVVAAGEDDHGRPRPAGTTPAAVATVPSDRLRRRRCASRSACLRAASFAS